MRDLSEYTAEVMRRADEKIRRRRRRIGTAATVCASFALVLAFALPMILRGVGADAAPEAEAALPTDMSANNGGANGGITDGLQPCDAPDGSAEGEIIPETAGRQNAPLRFEVIPAGAARVCADPGAAAELYALIDELTAEQCGASQPHIDSNAAALRIVLVFADGSTAGYMLCADSLISEQTGRSFALGADGLARLNEILEKAN